jgi:hypothetical protein
MGQHLRELGRAGENRKVHGGVVEGESIAPQSARSAARVRVLGLLASSGLRGIDERHRFHRNLANCFNGPRVVADCECKTRHC